MSVPAVIQRLRRLFADGEIDESAVVKRFLITASGGKNSRVQHYSLTAIIAVGFKVENERAVQFRKRANQLVKERTSKGFVMDGERLKSVGTILVGNCATAIDYGPPAQAAKRFFMTVQNEIRWAVQRFAAWQQVLRGPSYGLAADVEGAG